MTSDARARIEALDPRRSFIVQAPAGSGKTELLTQRYLRLLATVESPEQILAITFTRKAAAEMRSRILLALEAAAGAPPDSPHRRATWDLARAVREVDERRGWRLTEHPSRLQLRTIDALNASLSRRLPVLSGSGAALEPSTDPRPLYEAAGRRLIERLGDGSSVTAKLEELIVHLGNRVDRLVELLSELLSKRDQWLHPVMRARASDDLRTDLEATLQRVVERHLAVLCREIESDERQELLALLQYSSGNLLSGEGIDAARRVQLEQALSWSQPLGGSSDALVIWRCIATLIFRKDGGLYERIDKRHGFPTTGKEWKERMQSMLRRLAARPSVCEHLFELQMLPNASYGEEQWRTLQVLLELLPEAVAELQLEFQARGQADYVEIAIRALRSLGTPDEPTDLALAFDYRVQHILVDEFQDTSFAQLDLLERLTAGWSDGDGRTLFCVGDPMQSIYRFRQAEVGLFIQMQQQGLRHLRLEPLTLEANFRSTPVVVDWVNKVFPGVLAPVNDAEQGAVRYSPSVAALPGSPSDENAGVHVHPFVNTDDETEAAQVVQIIRDALQRDDTGRVAILVTARTHVDAIARNLTIAGIEFQAVEIEQLRQRPVVQDLMALTRALVHLGDRTAWLAVLRAPWCGLTLHDLHAIADRPSFIVEEAIRDLLSDSGDSLTDDARNRLQRVHDVLGAALTERGRWPLRIWVERTWNALGGPATLTRIEDLDDAMAYLERLEDLESAGDLEDVARLEEQLLKLFASGRVHGEPRVEIMTVHAAKGLEFETVILPGLHRRPRAESRELLRWTRIAGEGGGLVLAPIRAEGSENDSIYRWIELLERQRIRRERARLLYVAVTRAKRELHLLGTVKGTDHDDSLQLRDPAAGSMLQMIWEAVRSDFERAGPTSVHAPAQPASHPQTIRRLPLGWTPPPAEEIAGPAATPVVDAETERPVFDWVSQTSRHVGTLVHRELDRLSRAGGSLDVTAASRPRLMTELAELGVPQDRCAAACDRVMEAMQQALQDERGRWLLGLDGGISGAVSELAISGVVADQIIEGVIDRTFIDANGTRWIVDFKTSTHTGGGLEAFLDEEVARYRGQLRRYVTLMQLYRPDENVRAALYFPLMREWREVQ